LLASSFCKLSPLKFAKPANSIPTLSSCRSVFTVKISLDQGRLLSSYFPSLTTKAREVISYLITVVVSGVVGNFAYDVLKRLVLRLAKKRLEDGSSGAATSK
jgi:hypothetical protein